MADHGNPGKGTIRVLEPGRRTTFTLITVWFLTLAFLLGGALHLRTETARVGSAQDLEQARTQNQELREELLALNQELGMLAQGLIQVSGIQSETRDVAGLAPGARRAVARRRRGPRGSRSR